MLDIAQEFRELEYYTSQLNVSKVKLENAKMNNKRVDRLKSDLLSVENLREDLKSHVDKLEIFFKLVNKESANYKQRRLDFLTSYIDRNLAEIFPHESFYSKIPVDVKNNSEQAGLEIYNSSGKEELPRVSSGKMMQELISFSSAIGIAECLGKDKFYMDEAFAASDMENLTKIGLLLQKILDEGFQILLIEQKNDIYKDLHRREIHIRKDEITKEVNVTKVLDY